MLNKPRGQLHLTSRAGTQSSCESVQVRRGLGAQRLVDQAAFAPSIAEHVPVRISGSPGASAYVA